MQSVFLRRDLIENSYYPEIGYQELDSMLGPSRASALKITLPILTL